MKAFIIFRDRVSYAKRCFAALVDAGLEVYVVDHDSTWPAALAWLAELDRASRGERVMYRRENAYPWKLWEWGPFRDLMERDTEPYIVTDPDCVPVPDCPSDWVTKLAEVRERAGAVKAGLGLKFDDIPRDSRGAEVAAANQAQWRVRFEPGVYWQNTDTTLALYRPFTEYPLFALGPSVRLAAPYEADHLEWHERPPLSEELKHYYSRSDPGWLAPRTVRGLAGLAVKHVPAGSHSLS